MRDRPSLLAALAMQRRHLATSSAAYDQGDEDEALRLAVSLRVLLHDTASSMSLLGQLKVKDRLQFLSTAPPVNPRNLANTLGLAVTSWQAGVPAVEAARYRPLIAAASEVQIAQFSIVEGTEPPDEPTPGAVRTEPFDDWWTMPVARIQGRHWNRKQLVLILANMEGGAHIDPAQDVGYGDIAHRNAPGMFASAGGLTAPAGGNYVWAAVRQVAHEVQVTLDGVPSPEWLGPDDTVRY